MMFNLHELDIKGYVSFELFYFSLLSLQINHDSVYSLVEKEDTKIATSTRAITLKTTTTTIATTKQATSTTNLQYKTRNKQMLGRQNESEKKKQSTHLTYLSGKY